MLLLPSFSLSCKSSYVLKTPSFLYSVTGGELLTRLLHEDALTESDVAFYMRQLLLAVEHMHSRNVIHLDLKVEHLSYK